MCKRNTPDKNEDSMVCVRQIPQIKKRRQYGMCKRNSPDQKRKPVWNVELEEKLLTEK